MNDTNTNRRTALKLLGLGVGAAAGSGVVSAETRDPNATEPDTSTMYVALLGPQEGVETTARGITVFHHRDDELKFVLAVTNIEDTFMTHIHEDEPLGPITVWLHDFETQDERLVEGLFSGILDVGTITDDVIAAGRAEEAESQTVSDLIQKIDDGEGYVNVHTEQHPSGELAGQIRPFDSLAVGRGESPM